MRYTDRERTSNCPRKHTSPLHETTPNNLHNAYQAHHWCTFISVQLATSDLHRQRHPTPLKRARSRIANTAQDTLLTFTQQMLRRGLVLDLSVAFGMCFVWIGIVHGALGLTCEGL
jgi:hypothetical protein